MKVAITAQGTELDSPIDPRFGRASHILIVDPETMTVEAVDNSANASAFKGAGIQAATMVHDKGAGVLITGYCGPKAFATLEAAGIKVISDAEGTVADMIEKYKSGALSYTTAPNAEAHW